jgi:hypothetical protein
MLILKQKTKNVMETEKNFHEYEKKFFGGKYPTQHVDLLQNLIIILVEN